MASHRLPDEERPRRAVPAWVTAPPVDGSGASVADRVSDTVLEAPPASAASPAVPETVGPASTPPVPQGVPVLVADDIVVPDYPPQEELLPPAPTSPAVHTVPFDRTAAAPAPVSPIDAAPPAPVTPAVPVVGQPRFSVPGLEHVVVEGTEPEPVGPIGYRTPARFAHQRPAASAAAPETTPARSFDAVLAAPAPTAPLPVLPERSTTTPTTETGTAAATTPSAPGGSTPTAASSTAAPTTGAAPAGVRATAAGATTAPPTTATTRDGGDPRLQAGDVDRTDAADGTDSRGAAGGRSRRPAVGATPGALLGAVAGLATLGLAAWWFTAPATVHGVGLALGVLAVLLSVVILRNPAATWQRPIALLGVVLGGVGTAGLLWAVAAALLPMAGVTVPDITGTGTAPTLAP